MCPGPAARLDRGQPPVPGTTAIGALLPLFPAAPSQPDPNPDGQSRPSFRFRPRRRTVALGAAATLLAGAGISTVAVAHHGHPVRLLVDGQARTVETDAHTVRGVLSGAGLGVGAHDAVAPALDDTVSADDAIVLRHGRAVRLTVGNATETVWVTATDVQQALNQLGLAQSGAYVSASRSRPIGRNGLALAVRLPQRLRVVHDGRTTPLVTTAPTVGRALADNRLRLGAQDILSVPQTAFPRTGMVVRLTRVKTGRLTSDHLVRRPVQRVPDGHLQQGQTRVTDAGQNGIIRSTYAWTLHDGKLVSGTLVARSTARPMRAEVVHYGTVPRPAPAPRPAPVYSGGGGGGGGGLNWAGLARCESSGNPHSVSAGGRYYGLYQFSIGTWRSVGGSGLPSNASASEQTYRAGLLYARTGRSSWPVCGRYL